MEGGSSKGRENKDVRKKRGEKLGSVLDPNIEPFVSNRGHDPRELRSWAKRTGFVSTTVSGETERSASGRNGGMGGQGHRVDLEKGISERNESISPKIEIDPILGRTRRRGSGPGPEIQPVRENRDGRDEAMGGGSGNEVRNNGAVESNLGVENAARGEVVNRVGNGAVNGNGEGGNRVANEPNVVQKIDDGDLGTGGVGIYPEGDDPGDGGWRPSPKMVLGLRDNPNYG